MPNFYRVLKADPLDGEFTPNKPGAKPIKSFWCQVEGVDNPVMISKQVPNTPSLAKGHYGVLEPKRSSKGTQYFKFTSMQVPQGTKIPEYDGASTSQEPATQQSTASDSTDIPHWFHPFAIMIRELWDDMKARSAEEAIVNAAPESPDTATEDYDAEPTMPSKEQLEEIFGEPLPDPVEIPEDK